MKEGKKVAISLHTGSFLSLLGFQFFSQLYARATFTLKMLLLGVVFQFALR